MKEFSYKVVHTMDKDEYDKNIFEFAKKEPMISWLRNNIGTGGSLFEDDGLWYNTLEYPSNGLISVVHYFKHQNDAVMFKLVWG